jgi:hypothetical protein
MSDTADDDISGEIARIEAEIERLAEALERCRKIALMAKAALAFGGIGFVVLLAGLVRFDLIGLMAAITLVLGGLVAFGSNDSTEQQTLQALRDAEAERSDLIGGIDLRLVEDARGGFPRRRVGRGPAVS